MKKITELADSAGHSNAVALSHFASTLWKQAQRLKGCSCSGRRTLIPGVSYPDSFGFPEGGAGECVPSDRQLTTGRVLVSFCFSPVTQVEFVVFLLAVRFSLVFNRG